MENFIQEPGPKTPKIFFDVSTGNFELSGRSIPENSVELYKPVLRWLDEYVKQPALSTHMTIKLEYFNTTSSKCIIDLFRRLEKVKKQGYEVKVTWYYEEEDEDMKESGEDFREIIHVPMDIVKL
ncbi:MAG: DUF1987 domain-containing protein [Cyclobacteriaceae bacterium]|nr:DUF1987 domain-containing protein [Cyclobacteriaceae bacterium]